MDFRVSMLGKVEPAHDVTKSIRIASLSILGPPESVKHNSKAKNIKFNLDSGGDQSNPYFMFKHLGASRPVSKQFESDEHTSWS